MAVTYAEFLSKSSAIVVYNDGHTSKFSSVMPGMAGKIKKATVQKAFKYVNWYDDSKNAEPEKLLEVLVNNNIAPAILNTKAKFIVGNGIVCYREVVTDGKKSKVAVDIETLQEIKDFFKKSKINEQLFRGAIDIQYFGNCFFEQIQTADAKVSQIFHKDATLFRAGEIQDDGYVHDYYLCPDWSKPKYDANDEKKGNVKRRNAYYEGAAAIDLAPQFIIHCKEYTPGFPYYSLPSWYGSLKWMELANIIPAWHLKGIANGYVLRYIVEVSDSIFQEYAGDAQKEMAAKKKLQEEIDACLGGVQNVGKTIFVTMPLQQFIDKGVLRITPISADLHDEAFSILFQHSNTATTSGMAIDPTLCGIETEGKLSSGSEKRIAYDLWLRLHAVRPRQILLDVIETIATINGWDTKYPGIKFGFENVELTTLDKNPTGNQTVIAG